MTLFPVLLFSRTKRTVSRWYMFVLLTKCDSRTRGLHSANRAREDHTKETIFSQYGREQAWLIRDLLHD